MRKFLNYLFLLIGVSGLIWTSACTPDDEPNPVNNNPSGDVKIEILDEVAETFIVEANSSLSVGIQASASAGIKTFEMSRDGDGGFEVIDSVAINGEDTLTVRKFGYEWAAAEAGYTFDVTVTVTDMNDESNTLTFEVNVADVPAQPSIEIKTDGTLFDVPGNLVNIPYEIQSAGLKEVQINRRVGDDVKPIESIDVFEDPSLFSGEALYTMEEGDELYLQIIAIDTFDQTSMVEVKLVALESVMHATVGLSPFVDENSKSFTGIGFQDFSVNEVNDHVMGVLHEDIDLGYAREQMEDMTFNLYLFAPGKEDVWPGEQNNNTLFKLGVMDEEDYNKLDGNELPDFEKAKLIYEAYDLSEGDGTDVVENLEEGTIIGFKTEDGEIGVMRVEQIGNNGLLFNVSIKSIQ